jgi:hypothetical protein
MIYLSLFFESVDSPDIFLNVDVKVFVPSKYPIVDVELVLELVSAEVDVEVLV